MNLRDIHTPVLLERCIELLAPALERDGAVFVDATLGMGGHSEAFLERFPGLHLVGLDRDTDALRIAGERLAPLRRPRHARAHRLRRDRGCRHLGGLRRGRRHPVRSRRLVAAARRRRPRLRLLAGRPARHAHGPDARARRRPTSSRPTARATCGASSSATARRSSPAATPARSSRPAREAPIERSGRLVEILQAATPYAAQRTGHPAKRVFQALRIEVNRELSVLERAIPAALGILPVGGRIVVLAYQSLEDRIVKREFAAAVGLHGARGPARRASRARAALPLLVKGAELAIRRGARDQPARHPGAAARRRARQAERGAAMSTIATRPRPSRDRRAPPVAAPHRIDGCPAPAAARRRCAGAPAPAEARLRDRRRRRRDLDRRGADDAVDPDDAELVRARRADAGSSAT